MRTWTTPLMIGSVAVDSRVMLAPMAGVTDVVFRALVRRWAPQSLICTEMISSNGLVYSKRWDAPILDRSGEDRPIAYQLAAHRPQVLLEAAQRIIELHQPETIDLNMGCPVKKITGNFEGCALMKEPDTARHLIETLVKAIDRPVTVKFRLGWDCQSMNYLEFGKMCQDAGAQMVCLHARTRSQGYQPGCKWEAYGELKQALSIPVIANGDISTLEDARTVMETYGVDGVMIGRGCLGEPWMIGAIDHYLKTGERQPMPDVAQRLAIAYEHCQHYAAYKGEAVAMREMRKSLPWYVKGFVGASQYRSQLTKVSTLAEVAGLFEEIVAQSAPLMPMAV
ncbi:MAG: tRNA dihydrouridine synthase DusB [Candidatus Melainabacteria bacterium]|nr:tRNA dihydrouridine synthase DusB [Candidatus Melainabacteria bacterium]